VPDHQATQPGGIDSLESILLLLQILKIQGLTCWEEVRLHPVVVFALPFSSPCVEEEEKGLNTGLILSQGGVGGRRKEEGRRGRGCGMSLLSL
jgi:hypothetical protein